MQLSEHGKDRHSTFERTVRYIGFAFAGLAFILILVSVSSLNVARRVQQKYDYEVLQALNKLKLVNTLHHNEDIMENLVLSHIKVRDGQQKQLIRAKIKNEHDENTKVIRELEAATNRRIEKGLLNDVIKERKTYFRLADSVLNISSQDSSQKARQFYSTYLAPSYERHEHYLLRYSKYVHATADYQVKTAVSGINASVRTQLIFLILAMMAAVGAAAMIRWVLKWLRKENAQLSIEIEERIKLEQELLERKREYKMLFNRNPIPMWVYDQRDYRILEVNNAAVAEYGYSEEEFLQLTLLDIRAEEWHPRLQEEPGELQMQDDLTHKECRHKRKDGAVFKVEVKSHALPDKQGKLPRLVVAVNVQDREEALDQLKKNETLLREVSSSVPGAVFQYQMEGDGSFSFPYISDGVKELCSVTPEEVYQNPALLYKHLFKDDLLAVQRTTMESYENLTPWEQELRVWQPELKKFIWVRGHSLPTSKGNGTVLWNGTFINITKQKEAQEQLKRNEADLRALLDSSKQSIFLLDENLHVVSFNKEAADDVRKHLLKELRAGQSMMEFVSPGQVTDLVQYHTKAMSGETVVYEIGQGDYWHEITYQPVVSTEHGIMGVALNIRDISEQKKNFETLRRNELQLARAQQLAKLGSWEYNIAHDILTWSDSTYEIYGQKKGKFIPTIYNMFACLHPKDRLKAQNAHQNTIKTKRLLNLEYCIQLPGGGEKHLFEAAEVVCDKQGKVMKLYGTVQDITERKKAEQEITEATTLLQSTIENIPEIIFTADADLKILYISPQCALITGYPEEAFLGEPAIWLDAIHEKDKGPLWQKVLPKVKLGLQQEYEMRLLDSEGRLRWLLLRLSPGLSNGQVTRIYGSASDMTAYKEAEERQQQLSQQLQKQNQNLQQFAYIVSHNLRAPIANMLGLTSIYNRNEIGSPINQKVIDNMIKSAKLLDTTIRDLNDILTIRSKTENANELVSFDCLLQDIRGLLKSDMHVCDKTILHDFTQAPTLHTIRSYAHSILLNLLSNAVKYKSPSRKLVIRVTTFKVNNYICLRVQDNGLGIDLEKQQDNIFGLYKRFHKGFEGKGIGLHLVKTQVEMLEGKVDVESIPEQGTTFNVYFKY